jgi:hypothetical protein
MAKYFETYAGTATLRITTYSGETVALSERDAVAVSGKAGFFRVDVSSLSAGTYDFVFAGGIGADLNVEIGSAEGVYRHNEPTAQEISAAVLAAASTTPIRSDVRLVLGSAPGLFDDDDLIDEPIEVDSVALTAAFESNPPNVNAFSASDNIINQIAAGIDSGTVRLISPFDPKTQDLTLVQRADYRAGSLYGPISFLITREGVLVGDVVRFGATLLGQSPIVSIGAVVDVDGDLYAQVDLSRELLSKKRASECWKWELEHIDGSGNVTPLIVDQKMLLKPSHAE